MTPHASEPQPDDPRLERLRVYRLEENLSYERLAARMTAAGIRTRMRSLHMALTGRAHPRELTLYQWGRFLDYASARAARRQRRLKTHKRRKPKHAA